MIDILPAVDVTRGRMVWQDKSGRRRDPLEAAQGWQRAGSTWVHLDDLDRTYAQGDNQALLTEIVNQLDASVQLAGGIADEATLEPALATSATRVVLASAALARPDWVRQVIADGGERVAIGLDIADEMIVPRGASSPVGELFETIKWLDEAGASRYVVTDIRREGEMTGSNIALIRQICAATKTPVVPSGGIATLGDVRTLAQIPGVEAVVIGKAFYTRAFSLRDALGVLQSLEGRSRSAA